MKNLIILVISLVIYNCAPTKTFTTRADYYISDLREKSCVREKCEINLADNEVSLISDSFYMIINQFRDIRYHYALGSDQNNKDWAITVGNTSREPYLLLLSNDSTKIVVGFQCYKP